MNGEQFLKWLDGVKKIEKIEWVVQGEPLDANKVSVLITADGEQVSIYFGSPKNSDPPDDIQKAFLCLIANRVIASPNFDISFDPTQIVNSTRTVLASEGR